jgi:hypothetical protein
MDDQTPLSPTEIREIKSCTTRNYAAAAALVMAALLLFTVMVRLLSGGFDSKSVDVDTVGASGISYVYIVPEDLRNSTTFYDPNVDAYGNPLWPTKSPHSFMDQQVQVTVKNGCDTKYGAYQLVISGLTPDGNYTLQTDVDHYGYFGYGIGGYANQYGQATYTWDCYDEFGMLPEGSYGVLITDRATGFANVVYLTVGLVSHGK